MAHTTVHATKSIKNSTTPQKNATASVDTEKAKTVPTVNVSDNHQNFKTRPMMLLSDYDECLEYCPENVSTCDTVSAPRGSYNCTCNKKYQEFNYTKKECNCISGYRESEDGTYCECE